MTVPFEAQDFISGAVRNIRTVLRGATDDLLDFRRASGQMGDDLVSNLRRSRSAADDLGSRISGATDETRRLGRANVDDLFRRARSGADDLRRSASRADAEIRGMSDSRVHIRAKDEVSPVLDSISSKISTIAVTAGTMLLGSGLKDAMFGNVMDYYSEVSRSAALLPANVREKSLKTIDNLHAQGIIPTQTEGARQLADLAPLVKDKSKADDFLNASSKIQYIRPDSGAEEVNRALAQSADTFKESYGSVADSMMYAYKEVGDRQQDLFDTFWEYSGYIKSTGANSGQMANFLTQSVKEGSFNFDKPADFIKETFGVKALDSGDMEKYFKLRGAGKEEAPRQAAAFTNDINSGDEQRARGALMALVGDLASQTQSDLKQSLVSLGAAAAEDNGSAIMKTFPVPFQPAPFSISGTTDAMVKSQQDANPMQGTIQTRALIDQQMQDIGANLSTAVLPALKEFNKLLTDNKDDIQEIGSKVVGLVSGFTSVYSEHFTAINTGLLLIGGSIAAIKVTKFGKGLIDDTIAGSKKARGWLSRGKSAKNPTPTEEIGNTTKKRFSLQRGGIGGNGGGIGGLSSVSSMTVNASVVYLNEAGGGLGGNGGNRKRRGGRGSKRGGRGLGLNGKGTNNRNTLGGRSKDAIGARRGNGTTRALNLPDVDVAPAKARVTYRSPTRLKGPSSIPDVIPDAPKGGMIKGLFKGGKKALKAAGIVGTVAGIGFGGYDLYQATKKDGIRSAISSTGGSMLGGTAGGIVGGVVGSLAGPIGTAVGAAAGGWVGEKIGSMADNAGWTKKAVDGIYSISNWFTGKKEAPAAAPVAPPEAKVTFGNMTPEREKQLQKTFESFRSDVSKNGIKQALNSAMDQSGVTQTVDKIKDRFIGMLKSTDSKKAQDNIHAVGTASQKTGVQTKQLGATAKSSTQEIVQGAGRAGSSFWGISTAVKTATDQTRSHLMSLQNISSKGSSWGSNLISMMTSGIRSRFPSLTSAVSEAAGVIKNFLGFHSPTKKGPASKSDKWAGNFVSMFAGGLKSDSIREKMTSIAGTLRSGVQSIQGPQSGSMTGGVSIAPLLNQAAPATPKAVTIQNINIDFGELAKGITDFAQFAKMMTSSQGRALIRQVFGEELYKVLENGG
ncbi:hypothetical protein PMSD_14930 [Paenibacillus macquariensis subsp. defensor]|nr:hypothetical protein PMSD_14930 [Paenibacillus macquariensis subsp. defensor]